MGRRRRGCGKYVSSYELLHAGQMQRASMHGPQYPSQATPFPRERLPQEHACNHTASNTAQPATQPHLVRAHGPRLLHSVQHSCSSHRMSISSTLVSPLSTHLVDAHGPCPLHGVQHPCSVTTTEHPANKPTWFTPTLRPSFTASSRPSPAQLPCHNSTCFVTFHAPG